MKTLIEELQDLSNRYRSSYEELGDKDELVMANAIDDCIDIVKEHGEWVSVEEKLPKENTTVLIYDESLNKKKAISTGVLIFGKFVTYPSFLETLNVTHWRPLPQPPSEVQSVENQ